MREMVLPSGVGGLGAGGFGSIAAGGGDLGFGAGAFGPGCGGGLVFFVLRVSRSRRGPENRWGGSCRPGRLGHGGPEPY